MMPLVAEGQVKKDWADALPGRYKTGNIPADFVFFKPIKERLRKVNEIGANEYVSSAVLDTLVSDKTLSRSAQLEYLRAAVYDARASLYPVKP